MKIQINEINKRALIEFGGDEYFIKTLTEEEKERYYADEDYALVYRINMEYKGKPDQEGAVFMFISEKEKDRLKYIFDEI